MDSSPSIIESLFYKIAREATDKHLKAGLQLDTSGEYAGGAYRRWSAPVTTDPDTVGRWLDELRSTCIEGPVIDPFE